MFYPPCHLVDRHKPSVWEGLIEGDFKLALLNDPQSNPETLINNLKNVLGKLFFVNILQFVVVKIWFICLKWIFFLSLFINLFEGSTSAGNPNIVSFWNTSMTQENRVG